MRKPFFRHKLVIRKSLFSEKGREAAITVSILALAFFAASSSERYLSYPVAIAITLVLAGILLAFYVALAIRNQKRRIPIVIDTADRWICTEPTLAEVKSYLDYYCEIPRSEHNKGPEPRVSILDRNAKPIVTDYIIRPNEDGDVRIYFHPRKTLKIASTPPIKLAITGKR